MTDLSISPRWFLSSNVIFRWLFLIRRKVSRVYCQWSVIAYAYLSIQSSSVKAILSLVCGIFVISFKNGGLAVKTDSRASLQQLEEKSECDASVIKTELDL